MTFRGEQATPADFSLNPDGAYEYPGSAIDAFWARDGDTAEPPADFYAFFSPSYVAEDLVAGDFGECNLFVVAGPGTSATVRFSQAYDAGFTYAGSYSWGAGTVVTLAEGRTRLMALDPSLRSGAALNDGAVLLRVEVLSGTLNLDTLELQVEPPTGLMVPTGEWVWSDYVDAQEIVAEPLRSTTYAWANTAYGPDGEPLHSPNVDTLNARYAEAMAGSAGPSGGSASATASSNEYDALTVPNGFGTAEDWAHTQWWHWTWIGATDYGPIVHKSASGVTWRWDDYPSDYHVARPTVRYLMFPVEAEAPDFWERVSVSGQPPYEAHPTDAWGTVGWRASLQLGANWLGENDPYPPDLLARVGLTVTAGAFTAWTGPGPETLPSAAIPLPGAAPSPAVPWTVVDESMGGGYAAGPFDIDTPAAGTDLTFLNHGALGELDAYPFGTGASPGVSLEVYATMRAVLRLQPPRVRWRQVVWEPSDEAWGTAAHPHQIFQRKDSLGAGAALVYDPGTRQSTGLVYGTH